jgi:cyclase
MSTSLHDPVGLAPPRVEQVGDGVYAYVQPDGSWWINNTGFVVGRRGVVSIDACATQRRTRAYLEAIRSVTDRPVHTLVNTHHHGDHTLGNSLFGAGVTIVGHEQCRAEVLAAGLPQFGGMWTEPEWGDLELDPPFLTYRDGVDLWVDDLRCEIRHVGVPAHTTNDSVVWIPRHSVLFGGDLLFNGGTPFLLMGSLSGALRAVEALRSYRPRTIVPGHGAVGGPELIDDALGYLRFLDAAARSTHAAGLSPLDAARQLDLGQYADLLDSERIVGNLYRAYAELDGGQPGARIDVLAAMRDMVAYNGGHPLTCLA